jgi:hypothetical protein
MRDKKLRKKVNSTFVDKKKLPPKTPAMTQPVGIDKDGKLWTGGNSNNGGATI